MFRSTVLILAVLSIFVTSASLCAQGNDRDLGLRGELSRLPATGTDRPVRPGDFGEVGLFSKSGASIGAPLILVQEFRGPGAPPVYELPGEPGALAVSAACTPLLDGIGNPHSGIVLGPEGIAWPFSIPLAVGQHLIFQAAILDPAALNGLAISEHTSADIREAAIVTTMPGERVGYGNQGYGILAIDLDGDGREEILSSARGERVQGVTEVGRVRIYRHADAEAWMILEDPEPLADAARNHFGHAIAAGDFDADGFMDVAVGARGADLAGPAGAGKVVIFFGPDFLAQETILPLLPEPEGRFGQWLAAGDFDGDGATDLAVSSMRADAPNGILDAGAVEIFRAPLRGAPLSVRRLEAPAPEASAAFGYRMEAADLDGDGIFELAVASTYHSLLAAGTDWSGRVDVFRGSDFAHLHAMNNPRPRAMGLFGSDLTLKDLTGDGITDLVVSAELDDGAFSGQGTVWVFAGPDFQTSREIHSPQPSAEAGFGSGLEVGDFNGDQIPDLAVGEFWWRGTRYRQGRVHVLYGPDFAQHTTILEPAVGVNHQFGRRVRSADVNGDGVRELLVGAPASAVSGAIAAGNSYWIRL